MNCPIKVALSYSSGKTVMSCQQKYFYNKVAKLEKDSDYDEGDNMNLGKAFHKVLENTLHTSWSDKLLIAAMEEFGVDRFSRPLISAMLENYVKLHKASGLKIVRCEYQIVTPEYNGFIDFIAQASNGWYLGDNKTAAAYKEDIVKRLHLDEQVNLYSYFAPHLQEALQLKGPFLGFRYRQTIKSKAGTPTGLAKGTPTYDIEIPAHVLNPQAAWSAHLERHQIALALHNGEAPKRNLNACMDYFRPCEHWSKCYGKNYSETNPEITIHTIDSLESADLL
jgi:hypothetical protein